MKSCERNGSGSERIFIPLPHKQSYDRGSVSIIIRMTTTPTGITRMLTACIPLTTAGQLARWSYVLSQVNALEPKVQRLSDTELRKESLSLRYRARCGEPLVALLPEGYALVREAGRRTLNMRHFDVQILGGIAIFHRSIVEMQTGEGKTLTAKIAVCTITPKQGRMGV